MNDLNSEIDLGKAIHQTIVEPVSDNRNIQVDIKRLDLIHPEVNGNKWFKLKYNLLKAAETKQQTLLTFGGAWSNHIHAAASAGKLAGIKTIGIIRGEEPPVWSDTLLHAKECGMQLEFITRLAYAEKNTEDFVGWLHDEYGSFHLVPEGGSNFLGINGCMEILSEEDKSNYDYICCACGTGATLAGITMSAQPQQKIVGFPVFKHGEFLRDEVAKHLKYFLMDDEAAEEFLDHIHFITPYHFGGYGKWTDELIDFIRNSPIPLDQIYTAKMMFGVMDLIQQNFFPPGSKVLVIHTGGLQGRSSIQNLL